MFKKGYSGFEGRTHTTETRARMSQSHTGHPVTRKTRAKISKALTGTHPSKKTLRKLSDSHKGKYPSKLTRKKMASKALLRYLKDPGIITKNGANVFVSKPQIRMLEIVKAKVGPSIRVTLNHQVKTMNTCRYIDVAIPSLHLGFEYDGAYWHRNQKRERTRDKELTDAGWTIAHITKDGLDYIVGKLQS